MNTPQLDRDQSVDRLLRRSMRTGAVPDATDRCLDAETLAAWVDGALPADAAAAGRGARIVLRPVSGDVGDPRSRGAAAREPRIVVATAMVHRRPCPADGRRDSHCDLGRDAGGSTRIAPASASVDVQFARRRRRRSRQRPPPCRLEAPMPKTREEPPGVVDRFQKSTEREQRAQAAPRPGRDETATTLRESAADARRRDDNDAVSVPAVASRRAVG